ncbi:MAG: sigma-70 family RNA polymerase sigma factor [Chitinophagaceae bacterium]|nr:sigma-70 family RNA polymerase sigma factor [Chitinophagaceae bacterium]
MPSVFQMDLVKEILQADINKPVTYMYEQYFEPVEIDIRANGGNHQDAADIFQEAVLIVVDKIKSGKFRGDSSVKTFLLGIARNLWLHEKRSRSRRSDRETQFARLEETGGEFRDRMFSVDESQIVKKLFEQVGELCSKILGGVYYEKMAMKDLLRRFNYENEQVLRNRKSRCMKKLKELLSNDPLLFEQLKTRSIYE